MLELNYNLFLADLQLDSHLKLDSLFKTTFLKKTILDSQ